MRDFQSVINSLQQLNRDAQSLRSEIAGALRHLDVAVSNLEQADDPHAQAAASAARSAYGELRQATVAWLSDYQRRSDELCRRIAA